MSNDPFDFDISSMKSDEEPLCTAVTFSLTKDEINFLKKKAIDGDNLAAFKLYMYYDFSNYNKEESYKWKMKSAELGNATAQYNLSVSFYVDKQYDKALFWCKKAKINGAKGTKKLLKEIRDKI